MGESWEPRKISIYKKGIGLKGYSMDYYYKQNTSERTSLASEILMVKENSWEYVNSSKIRGYIKKFLKINNGLFSNTDFIIPVPGNTHSRNRVENLALCLGKVINKPVHNNITNNLNSIAYVKNQYKEFDAEYNKKVEHFELVPLTNIPCESKILLFDDIATTGATLFICAEKLIKSGFNEITLFTLCSSRTLSSTFFE